MKSLAKQHITVACEPDSQQPVDAKNYRQNNFINFKIKKMKSKKMSLANIQGKLSRTEMKNIMAGVSTPPDCNDNCENGCGSGYYCDDISCGMIVKKGCIKKEV